MPDAKSTVATIKVTAVDEASAVLRRIGESGVTAADSLQSQTSRVGTAMEQMTAKVSSSADRLESTLNRMSGGAGMTTLASRVDETASQMDSGFSRMGEGATGAASQVERAASQVAAAGTSFARGGEEASASASGYQRAGEGATAGASQVERAGSQAAAAGAQFTRGGEEAGKASAGYRQAGESAVTAGHDTRVAGEEAARGGVGFLSTSKYVLEFVAAYKAAQIAIGIVSGGIASNFEDMTQKIQGSTGISNSELASMRSEILKLGREGPQSLETIGKAFERAANLGYHGADAMRLVTAGWKAAIATGGQTADVVDTLATAMRDFKIPTHDAEKTVSTLLAAAAQGNLRLPELVTNFSKVGIIASSIHMPLSDAASVFSELTRAAGGNAAMAQTYEQGMLLHMVAPTKAAITVMAQMKHATGVDMQAAFAQFATGNISFTKVMELARQATQGNTSDIFKLFGGIRGGVGAIQLLGSGWNDYLKISTKVHGSNSLLQTEFDNMMSTLGAKAGTLKNRLQEIAIGVSSIFLPMASGLVSAFSGLANLILTHLNPIKAAISSFVADVKGGVGGFASGFLASMAPLGAVLKNLGSSLLAIVHSFSLFTASGHDAAVSAQSLSTSFGNLGGLIGTALIGFVQGLSDTFQALANAFVAVRAQVTSVASSLGLISAGAQGASTASANMTGIVRALGVVIGVVTGLFAAYRAGVLLVTAAQTAGAVVTSAWSVVTAAFSVVLGAVRVAQAAWTVAITAGNAELLIAKANVAAAAILTGTYSAAIGVVRAAQILWTTATTAGNLEILVAKGSVIAITAAAYAQAVAMGVVRAAQYAWNAAILLFRGEETGAIALMSVSRLGMLAVRGAALLATAAQWLWNAAMTANPIGIVIVAISALVIAILYAWSHWKGFHDFVIVAWNTLKNLAGWLGGAFAAILRAIGGFIHDHLSSPWQQVEKFANAAWNTLKGFAGWLSGPFSGVLGFIGGKIGGLASALGKIPGAVQNAVSSVPTGSSSGNPYGSLPGASAGGPGAPGYTSGSQYGAYGSPSNNAVNAGSATMLRQYGGKGAIMDTDFAAASGTPYRLPKGGSYTLVANYMDPNIGGVEVWRNNKNGGEIMFLHGEATSGSRRGAVPAPYAVGETVAGGTYVGKSGHAQTTAYGNNPNFYHLCVVTDTGERVWLTTNQMAAAAAGKSPAGGPTPITASQLAKATKVGYVPTATSQTAYNQAAGVGQPIPVSVVSFPPLPALVAKPPPAASLAPFEHLVAAFPGLQATIQGLPAGLSSHFEPILKGIESEWKKDQQTYLSNLQKTNNEDKQKLQNIYSRSNQEQANYLRVHGVTISNATVTHANAVSRILAAEQITLAEDKAKLKVALENHNGREAATLRVHITDLERKTKAHVTELDQVFGAKNSQEKKNLDLWLKNHRDVLDRNVENEKRIHQEHIDKLHHELLGHVAGIHKELADLKASMSPDKLWDTLVKGVKDTVSRDTKTMSLLAMTGSPITTTKPIYTQEEVAVGRNQSGVQTRWESVQTGVQKTVESVGQQMEKWAKEAAVSVLKTEALSTALAASVSMVDLFGGKLSDFATQLGTIRTMWTEQILAGAVQGKAANQTYLDNIAKVDEALKVQQTAQVGLNAIIATNEHSFSGMAAAADSLYQDTLPRFEDAMVASGSAQNEYTGTLVKESAAQRAFGVAQAAASVIVGQLTGNLSLLDSGLKAFASKAVEAVTLWATNLGRIGGDAANSGISILKLGQDSTKAADSLGTLPDIISGLSAATSAIEAAAETQFARTGSIDPATLSAYGNAQGQVTTATYDQYGAQLLLYRSTGDLNNYYQVLGKEISSLQQTTIPELTAKYGANSTQVAAATATLKTLQTEYTGLGDELKILGGDTTLTADQVAAAGKAFAVFTGTGLDPAILAAQQFGAIISAGLNPQQQFNDNTATGATAVQTLGTNALSTASDLLTLDTSIASVVGAFAAAVVNIQSSVSGSTPGNTPGGMNIGSGIMNAINGSGFPGAGTSLKAAVSGGGGGVSPTGGYTSPTYTQHSPGSALSSSDIAAGALPAAPSGYTWSYGPNGTSIVLIASGASLSSPQGSVIDSSGAVRIAYGSTMGNLVAGGPPPTTTATTTATAPTGQTVSLGGGQSGYLLNGTVYMPGSQPVAGMVVQNNGTLAPFNASAQVTSNLGNAATTSVNGTGYTGPTSSIPTGTTSATAASATTTQPISTIFGGAAPSGTTMTTASGTGPGYRQWNALGATLAQANQTLVTYGLSPSSFWAMDYNGQYAALQSVGIMGSDALEASMRAGTYKGPGNPITGGYKVPPSPAPGASSGTSATAPISYDPSSSTLLPGGLTAIAQRLLSQLSGMSTTGTMYPGGNKSGLLPLGGSGTWLTTAQKTALSTDLATHNYQDMQQIVQTAWQQHGGSFDWSSLFGSRLGLSTALKDTSHTTEVKSLLQSILLTLKQELGGQIKLTADRMEQLIKQGEDILHHPMHFTSGQSDETTFDTLTRLRPA